ncbi:MAG: DTW domain-containing protein [Gammaproteobacteria bacterium]|nr:DTW domain-containing protein [Gammaproteobacteria bacterium]
MSSSSCGRCHLRRDLCICQRAPSLSAPLNLLLLTHPNEAAKASNSGRLLLNALPGCRSAVWQRRQSGPWLQALTYSEGSQPLLIFPAADPTAAAPPGPAAPLNSAAPLAPAAPLDPQAPLNPAKLAHRAADYCFILLDATWQQARKMLRQTPELQCLPRLQLSTGQSSRYGLRKHQPAGHLSTVEAGILLLRELGREGDADQLDGYFQRFLQCYEAHRSNHPDSSDNGGAPPCNR